MVVVTIVEVLNKDPEVVIVNHINIHLDCVSSYIVVLLDWDLLWVNWRIVGASSCQLSEENRCDVIDLSKDGRLPISIGLVLNQVLSFEHS